MNVQVVMMLEKEPPLVVDPRHSSARVAAKFTATEAALKPYAGSPASEALPIGADTLRQAAKASGWRSWKTARLGRGVSTPLLRGGFGRLVVRNGVGAFDKTDRQVRASA
jgi:hypothetical protein